MTTISPAYGTYNSLTVTNLNSLASSATAGWKSDRVSNVSALAVNYEIAIKLTMANTAPASDKLAYLYASPAITTDGGTTWIHADGGTTTLPNGSEGTYTIANPPNLKLIGTLNYTTQQMVMQGIFSLCPACMADCPDGFELILINFTGAALSGSGNVVAVRPVNYSIA